MMKRVSISVFVILFVAALISFVSPAGSSQKIGLRTIIIDAGHGGRHTGAKGVYSYEKDICLDIALKLGKKLEAAFPDLKVLYTRTTDATTDNRWRADFANKSGGDLFVSIHANSMPQIKHTKYLGKKKETYYVKKGGKRIKKTRYVPRYSIYYTPNTTRYGTETYIWAADRTDEKEEFVAEQVEDSSEFVPDINDPEFKAKALLWTKKHFDKSLMLASMVEEEFANAGRLSTGVKQRTWEGIWVLQATGMPSILVETGFISNPKEEDYLNSESGQNEVAENIFTAIKRYKATIESKQAPNTSAKSKQSPGSKTSGIAASRKR